MQTVESLGEVSVPKKAAKKKTYPRAPKRVPLADYNYQFTDEFGNPVPIKTVQVLSNGVSQCDSNLVPVELNSSLDQSIQNDGGNSMSCVKNFEVLQNIEVPTLNINQRENIAYQVVSSQDLPNNLNDFIEYV